MSDPWDVLGVERGADRVAIRRAYARRLKLTNPEDDPAGFMALREAYEWLLDHVAMAEFHGEDHWDEPAEPVPRDSVAPRVDVAGDAASGPWGSASVPRAEDERGAVDRLLDAIDRALALRGPDVRAARTAALDALFASPALDQIKVSARAEYRLAEMIAEHVPASDMIIVASVDRFGWADQKRAGEWPFSQVMARLDEWHLIGLLEKPDDPLHAAWRMLTRRDAGVGGRARRWWIARSDRRDEVGELLDYAEYAAPGVAHSFDSGAAAWWKSELERDRLRGPPFLWRAAAGLALFVLLRIWDVKADVAAWVGATAAIVSSIDVAAMQWMLAVRTHREMRRDWGAAAILVALALPALLLLVPLTPVVAAITGAVAFALAWTVRLAWHQATGVDRTRRWATVIGFGLLFYLFATLDRAVPLAQFAAWLAAAWLLLLVLPIVRPRAAEMVDALTRDRAWPALMAYAAAVAALGWFGPDNGQAEIIRAGLVLVALYAAGGIAVFAARPLPPLMLWLTMVSSAFAMIAAAGSMGGATTLNSASPGRAIVAAHLEDDPARTEAPEREATLAMVEMRRRNPALAERIDALLARGVTNVTAQDAAAAAIDSAINDAVTDLLPATSNALIARNLRFRLLALRDFSVRDSTRCAKDRLLIDERLSDDTRAEARRLHLAIAAHGAADPAERRDVGMVDDRVLKEIATTLRAADMPGATSIARCDRKIAGLAAMSALSDDQIATLTRAAHAARIRKKAT